VYAAIASVVGNCRAEGYFCIQYHPKKFRRSSTHHPLEVWVDSKSQSLCAIYSFSGLIPTRIACNPLVKGMLDAGCLVPRYLHAPDVDQRSN